MASVGASARSPERLSPFCARACRYRAALAAALRVLDAAPPDLHADAAAYVLAASAAYDRHRARRQGDCHADCHN